MIEDGIDSTNIYSETSYEVSVFDRPGRCFESRSKHFSCSLLIKEVIQPQVLLQLPCYDFTPITNHTVNSCLPKVSSPFSGATSFRDVTGGVYKARERIHRSVLIFDY